MPRSHGSTNGCAISSACHCRAGHCKSGLPDLQRSIIAELGQARVLMQSMKRLPQAKSYVRPSVLPLIMDARVKPAHDARFVAAPSLNKSLPGLTLQVGFTRLAAFNRCRTRASPSSDAIHEAIATSKIVRKAFCA